jgi:hypothetical protein
VGGGSARNLERPRRDPKDTIALFNLLQLAGSDSEAGRYDDAVAKVREALAADPEIIEAYSRLGNIQAPGIGAGCTAATGAISSPVAS